MEPKPKGNSTITGLTPEQQTQLDRWLFEANATYREVVARCRKEFDVEISLSAVGRHYRRQFRAGTLDRVARTLHNRNDMLKTLEHQENPQDASYFTLIGLAELMALDELTKPEKDRDFRKIGYLLRVVVAAREEHNNSVRAMVVRQKFEYDFATECLIHKVKMDAVVRDESLSTADKIQKFREELFGPNLPK